MALRPSYTNLQLDPDDLSGMAAFSALCWQHVLEYVTPRWIWDVREGFIRLQHRTTATASGQSCNVYNEHLNDAVSAFVKQYVVLIWPLEDEDRTHLLSARHL